MTLKSIEELRKAFDACTTKAGIKPNEFDTVWITKSCAVQYLDEIETEIAERYMELPLDADGVPIRVGDKVQFRNDEPVTVDSIGTSKVYENDSGFFGSNGGFYGQGTLKNVRHVKPRTLFDVLAEVENGELSINDAESEIRELLGVVE